MSKYTPPEWVRNAVFYQIFVDRFANGDLSNDPPGVVHWGSTPTRDNYFGGDLQGILDHLPYLKDLGISALYLTPIFSARSNHKYDTCDYRTIDASFGTTQLLRKLVNEAHSSGIRIILDAVFNHCGDGFWAFEDVKKNGAPSKYSSWFFIDRYPVSHDPPNYQTCGGTWYLPKLNTTNPEVAEYLLNTALYWIETCEVDGWRLDVPWKVPLGFWMKFRERIKRVNPDAYIVGEVWRDARLWLQGDTFDGVMNYQLRNHILDYCVYDAMDAEDFNYEINLLHQSHGPFASVQMNLLGSHDTPRLLTLCQGNIERFKLAITFLFTYIGTPMIYYGDEVGLTGGNDPECRKGMPWDVNAWEPEIVKTFKCLIHARHEHPALQRGEFLPLLVFNGLYAYLRNIDDDAVVVILNPREEHHHVKIPIPALAIIGTKWRNLLGEDAFRVEDMCLEIDIMPSRKAFVLVPHNS